jgi:transcription initiation factor IIE alpha subunit
MRRILELDETGISTFHKSITDPKELYRVAWFQKYGEEAFNVLKAAYEEEITRLKKDNRAPVVVKNDRKINTIHELNY